MNKEKIKNNRVVRHMYYFANGIVRRAELEKRAQEALVTFGRAFETEAAKKACVNDMVRTYARYGFDFSEFLCFEFENKTKRERLAFVADWEHLGYACTLNAPENDSLFDNKHETYEKYKKFYRRELVLFEKIDQGAEFERFATEHPKFVIKPVDMCCGAGIQIAISEEHEAKSEWFAELLKQNGRFVAEGLILQAESMAKLHPASVNTMRVPTVRMDDSVLIVNPFLRVGQGGKCVDNAGAGGIICSVDAQSGRVFAAADMYGRKHTTHPQTNEPLIGMQIPRWDEAKAFVRELAQVVPDNRYTGWDLALAEDGWMLVEANRRGQFVWQIASQKGFREEINGILKKFGKKY